MTKISIVDWNKETEELLLEYAIEHGLHVDELNKSLVAKVVHLRCAQWINYKNMMQELI